MTYDSMNAYYCDLVLCQDAIYVSEFEMAKAFFREFELSKQA